MSPEARVALGALAFVASAVGSVWLTRLVLLRLPEDHLVATTPARRPALMTAARNAGALALFVVGVALSLPGVPGQGLLTLVVSLLVADFPGKLRLERRVLGHPRILAAINRVRAGAGASPLRAPAPPESRE